MQIKDKINDYKLYSFDIFDTLITRTTALPVGIFTIMAKHLHDSGFNDIPTFIKDNFYSIRVEAEGYARTNNYELYKKQDIAINDIYDVIKLNNNLSNQQIMKLINLEIETELKNIVPISKNILILKELIEKNKRVVLITDMYHSEKTIRRILTHIDPIFENIKIYVSCECGCAKHFGDLYEFVKHQENVSYNSWLHFGDNKYADIKQAKLKGINTILVSKEELKPYEKKALKLYENDYYIESLTGISKYARIKSDDKSPVYQFACSFAAPILFNYVNWILNYSLENNIKNLYFIARDGYVLKLIADTIIFQKKYNIKTKYIYGSRMSWRIPDLNNVSEYIDWICMEYWDRFTLNFLASRLNIEVSKIQKLLAIKDCNKLLKKKEILKIKEVLTTDENFKKEIVAINKEKKEVLIDYLKQEIDFNEDQIAFVDVHGSGRTQDMLANIINQFYSGNILGFYYHTLSNCEQDKSIKKSFIATNRYIHHSIELLCRNTDGQTIGYNKENEKIVPILENINSEYLEKWGYRSYLNGIETFCINACDFEIKNNISLISYNLYKFYFDYLFKFLDKDTANIIGSIPYSDIGTEKNIIECAPIFRLKDIIRLVFAKEDPSCTTFISIARSNKIFKYIDKLNNKYGSLRKFLINIYINKRERIIYIRFLGIKISLSRLFFGILSLVNHFNTQIKNVLMIKQNELIIKQFNKRKNELQKRSYGKTISQYSNIVCSFLHNNMDCVFENKNLYCISNIDNQKIKPNAALIWGEQPLKENIEVVNYAYEHNIPLFIAENSFLRSAYCWADNKINNKFSDGISFIIDNVQYFDATQSSSIEKHLDDKNLIITPEQINRAKSCISKIVKNKLTKYNHQPIYDPQIGRKGVKKVLVIDQSYRDMSIAKGLANDKTFEIMLKQAIRENPNSDIIIKTHPDIIQGSRKGYYQHIKTTNNIYAYTDPINPISLIEQVDKVYVCSSQFGFEALMCGKEVHTFGMPFYAGWGLTIDWQKCKRRTNKRSLEEIFYIAYIMHSYFVNPEKKCRCEIEEAMDYLIKLRDEYFEKTKV